MTLHEPRRLASIVVLAASWWSSPGRAEAIASDSIRAEAEAQGALAPASPPEAVSAIQLRVHGDFTLTQVERLSAGLSAALERPVHPSLADAMIIDGRVLVTVTYRADSRELAVALTDEHGGTISRVVQAPEQRGDVIEAAVLLAQNLYVHQAPELLPQREAAPPTSPIASTAEPETTPALVDKETARGASPVDAAANEQQATPGPYRVANASVFFPLATNAGLPNLHTSLDFGLFFSRIGMLEGLQLGNVNFVSDRLVGVQFGALVNSVGGAASGLQLAGLFNEAEELEPGFQVAFVMNRARSGGRGAQLALGLNDGSGRFGGLQSAFGFNHQLGGVQGVQLAGAFNHARHLKGLQLSAVNVAADVRGIQFGIVNVAEDVRGAQVGLVNVADDIEGVPIGLFNVTRSGGVHVPVWISTHAGANVGLKFATRYTYTLIGMSTQVLTDDSRVGPFFAMGVRIPTLPRMAIDVDLSGSYQLGTRLCCYESNREERLAHAKDRSYYGIRFIPNYSLHDHLTLFVGGGLGVSIPFAFYSNFEGSDRNVEFAPEALAGVEF